MQLNKIKPFPKIYFSLTTCKL